MSIQEKKSLIRLSMITNFIPVFPHFFLCKNLKDPFFSFFLVKQKLPKGKENVSFINYA